MGVGFVVLIHLVIIFILSLITAIIGSIIVYFLKRKQNPKRKIFFAILAPFVGLYSLYICGIIGSSIVSEKFNVDIGFGDAWYVPLEDDFQLIFIDSPGQAFIGKDGQAVVSSVSEIEQNGNQILGKAYGNNYFSYNTKTNELKNFSSEDELVISNSNTKLKLINAFDFYEAKKKEIVGVWFTIVGVFSVIISVSLVYLLKVIILI